MTRDFQVRVHWNLHVRVASEDDVTWLPADTLHVSPRPLELA